MSDARHRPAEAPLDRPEREPSTTDLIDNAIRKIVTAIVAAGAIVGLAIYAQPSPPRYQVSVSNGQIVRIDTRSGTVIACEAETCATILRHGQHLERHLPPHPAAVPAPAPAAIPAPAPAPALPAPAAAPATR